MRALRELVAFLALLGAGALGMRLWSGPSLGGARGALRPASAEARLAEGEPRALAWSAPERDDALASAAEEGRVALAPDGALAVLASGSRGLDAELFVASRRADGGFDAPRPLRALCSAADELDPAFGGGFLWFASDREGSSGGLDLWRAPYEGGSFGIPERVEALCSAADERAPAPSADGTRVLFASDRGASGVPLATRGARGGRADSDLFEALREPGEAGGWSLRRLDELCAAEDELDPALSADGALLVFAARRGGDSLDLWRSLRRGARFEEPRRIEALSSALDERAPALEQDGLALRFARPSSAGDLEPWRARSLELFGGPAHVPWSELVLLALLLALGLAALFARRWRGLDLVWITLALSLLAHLLLALWLRRLFLEAQELRPRAREQGAIAVRWLGGEGAAQAQALARAAAPSGALEPPRPSAASAPANAPWQAPRASEGVARIEPLAPDARSPRAGAREQARLEREPAREAALAEGEAPLPRAEADEPLRSPAAAAAQLARAPADEGREALERAAPRERAALEPGPLAPPRSAQLASALGPLARAAEAARPERAAAFALAEASAARAPELGDRAEPLRRADPSSGAAPPEPAALSAPTRAEDAGGALARGPSAPSAPSPLGLGEPSPPSGPGAAPEGARVLAPSLRAARASGAAPLALSQEASDASGAGEARVALADRARAFAPGAQAQAGAGEAAPAPPSASALVRAPDALRPSPSAPAFAAALAPPPLDAPRAHEAPRVQPLAGERAHAAPQAPAASSPYAQRSGARKLEALEHFGGDARTEDAVARGLAYLARIQRRLGDEGGDQGGYWGELEHADAKYGHVAIGKTALCLLAFLAAGHTPQTGEHAQVVSRALAFLLAVQDEQSGHFGPTSAYAHGLATLAVAECHSLTRDPALLAPLQRALAHLLAQQLDSPDPRLDGGWGYYGPEGQQHDRWARVSVSAWQVLALVSARASGLEVPQDALERARAFLVRAEDPREGWLRYDHDPDRLRSSWPTLPASTPAGLFALSLLGEPLEAPSHARAVAFVLERAPTQWKRASEDDFVRLARGNPYFWYQGTLLAFRLGGAAWKRWNEALKACLLPAQAADGSWPPIDVYAREYARDGRGDASYSSALAVLSLEVYYRYDLPLLRATASADAQGSGGSALPEPR